jgi:hypothetical protein
VCGKVAEHFVHTLDYVPKCCSTMMERLFPIPSVESKLSHCGQVFNVDGVTLENLPGGPQHFDSYKKLKSYAKENNLDIQAIL